MAVRVMGDLLEDIGAGEDRAGDRIVLARDLRVGMRLELHGEIERVRRGEPGDGRVYVTIRGEEMPYMFDEKVLLAK